MSLLSRVPSPSPVTPRAHLLLATCVFSSGRSSSLQGPLLLLPPSFPGVDPNTKGKGGLELGPEVLVNGSCEAMEQPPDGLVPFETVFEQISSSSSGDFCIRSPTVRSWGQLMLYFLAPSTDFMCYGHKRGICLSLLARQPYDLPLSCSPTE